tara:strand:+ start:3066 stop:3485 length:420 start_codon:yes stop_codon:yes gene_type:complete
MINEEVKKKRQQVFQKAMDEAFGKVKEAVCLPIETLKKLWNENIEDRTINWFHDLKHERDDIVILDNTTEVPQTFCKIKKKVRPIYFRCSRFFQNDNFLASCDIYYNKFGLTIDIVQDNTIKGKWWVNLKEKSTNSCIL